LEACQKPIFLSFSMQSRSHFYDRGIFILPERWERIVETDDEISLLIKKILHVKLLLEF